MCARLFAIAALMILFVTTTQAGELPTSTTHVTKDDLRTHPLGKEIGELNDRMRQLGKDAEKFEKGTDTYNVLKAAFDELKKERNKKGDDLRGLRGFEVILYGDQAIGNSASVKQGVINFYIRNPRQRHMQPFHAWYNKQGRQIVSIRPPDPDDVGGQRAVPETPPGAIVYPDDSLPEEDDEWRSGIFGFE